METIPVRCELAHDESGEGEAKSKLGSLFSRAVGEDDADVVPSLEMLVKPYWSPMGASRFLELVRAGYYDGVALNRVVPGFLMQVRRGRRGPQGSRMFSFRLQNFWSLLVYSPMKVRNLQGRFSSISSFLFALKNGHLTLTGKDVELRRRYQGATIADDDADQGRNSIRATLGQSASIFKPGELLAFRNGISGWKRRRVS